MDKMSCVAIGGNTYYGTGGYESNVVFGSYTLTNAGYFDLFW
jgi:hypothetical protein